MKKKTIKILKLVLKYLLPAVLGWIEGDTQVISESIMNVLGIFI